MSEFNTGRWAGTVNFQKRGGVRSAAITELHFAVVAVEGCVERVIKRGGEDAQALVDHVLRGLAHLYERPLLGKGCWGVCRSRSYDREESA